MILPPSYMSFCSARTEAISVLRGFSNERVYSISAGIKATLYYIVPNMGAMGAQEALEDE